MTSIPSYRFKTISEYHRQVGLPKPEHPLISLVHMDSITPPVTEGSFSLIFDIGVPPLIQINGRLIIK